jgi:hypothetical protein
LSTANGSLSIRACFFKEDFPEDDQRFQNVVYIDAVKGGRDKSLRHMRERMFKDSKFDTVVFIGGMEGIVEEFELFRALQPDAQILPIASTGGAAMDVASRIEQRPDLWNDLDYVSLFHRMLQIDPRELRYDRPDNQPKKPQDRLWERS